MRLSWEAFVVAIALGGCANRDVRDATEHGGAGELDNGRSSDASRRDYGDASARADAGKGSQRDGPADASRAETGVDGDTIRRGVEPDAAPRDSEFWQQHVTHSLELADRSDDIFEVPRLSISLGNFDISHVDQKVLSISNAHLSLGAVNQPEPIGFETAIDLVVQGDLPLTVGETALSEVSNVALLLQSRVVTIRDTETMAAAPLATLHYTDDFLGWAVHSKRELMIRVRTVSSELFIRYTYGDELSARSSALLPEHVRAFQWLAAPAYSAQNEDPGESGGFLAASDVNGASLLVLTAVPGTKEATVNVRHIAQPEQGHSFRFDSGAANVQWWQSHFAADLSHVYIPLSALTLRAVDANLLTQNQVVIPYADAKRAAPTYLSHDGRYETSISNEQQEWQIVVAFTLVAKEEHPLSTKLTYKVDLRLSLDQSYARFVGELGIKHYYGESDFD